MGSTPANRAKQSQISEEPLLDVRGLKVSFGKGEKAVSAVKDLSFHVDAGETVAIVGESGSGKSVTSLSIMRLVEFGGGTIADGNIMFRNRAGNSTDIAALNEKSAQKTRGDEISMIFQEPMTSLNPVFQVGDQIVEAITVHQNKSQKEAKKIAAEMLETVRIPDAASVMKRFPHQLSGGMRQRVMIALALCCTPQLLIADEPTTALDVTVQAQILQLIRDVQKSQNMAVLFITHDMGVVAEMADRVIVMYRGEMVEEGDVESIFSSPQHPYTKALLNAVPRLGAMNGTREPAPFQLLDADSGGNGSPHNTHLIPVDYSADPLLTVRGLTTRFDLHEGLLGRVRNRVHAVEQIDLDIWPGETLGMVGESGCGKSTTGRSILRLVESSFTKLNFAGQEISDLTDENLRRLRQEIQFIFQDPYASLNPRLTVGYSICEPMLIHGLETKANAFDKAVWLLEQVGLSADHAKRFPHAFSGGQRQRIAIARALSTNPKLIIADEAVSALDVSVQARLLDLLRGLVRDMGLSAIIVTHDLAVVRLLADRLMVMKSGRVVEAGLTDQVLDDPQHAYSQLLVSSVLQV